MRTTVQSVSLCPLQRPQNSAVLRKGKQKLSTPGWVHVTFWEAAGECTAHSPPLPPYPTPTSETLTPHDTCVWDLTTVPALIQQLQRGAAERAQPDTCSLHLWRRQSGHSARGALPPKLHRINSPAQQSSRQPFFERRDADCVTDGRLPGPASETLDYRYMPCSHRPPHALAFNLCLRLGVWELTDPSPPNRPSLRVSACLQNARAMPPGMGCPPKVHRHTLAETAVRPRAA